MSFKIPAASATEGGALTTGTQTIAGVKTFSSAPVITDASGIAAASATVPGIVTTGLQHFVGAKRFDSVLTTYGLLEVANGISITSSGVVDGRGFVPLGGVIPIINSGISGAFAIPSVGTVSQGWMQCSGAAVPGGNAVSGTTPNISNDRFIMGVLSTDVPSTGGSNTQSISQASYSVPAHYHGFGTGSGITASITHTHAAGQAITGSSAATDIQHTHTATLQDHTHGVGEITVQTATGTTGTSFLYRGNTSIASSGANSLPQNLTSTMSIAATHTHAAGSLVTPALTHSGNSGSATGTIGLVTGGQDGNAPIPLGAPTANAALGTTDNRPKYISAVYLIRVN